MRIRENFAYRRLDFAFPRAALDAVFGIINREIRNDVAILSVSSGPLVVAYKAHSEIIHKIMLIEEEHADRIIAEFEEVCKPFNTGLDYKGFGEED